MNILSKARSVGILGGMAWSSTVTYYTELNKLHHAKFGGLSSAPLHLRSFDFSVLARLARQEDWDSICDIFTEAANGLSNAGAEAIAIACNTMHRVLPSLRERLDVPVLSIVDAVGRELRRGDQTSACLLATKSTTEGGFYQDILEREYGITVHTPNPKDTRLVDAVIFKELARGIVTEAGCDILNSIVAKAIDEGGAVLLCCTELGLAIDPSDYTEGAVIDSTLAHVRAIHDFAVT